MDIIKITSTTDRYNFHSHTQFCDGRATMETMAQAAADAGFEHWGFSPHSPVPIKSSCNMAESRTSLYLDEVARLKARFADRLNLYAAMEIDYLDDNWGPAHPYFKSLPLDYRIGSVHFVPSDEGFVDVDGRFESFRTKMERYFHNDIRHVVDTFYDQSEKMLEAGGFDIIGHFDKIGHNASMFKPGIEDEPWYRDRVNSLIDLITAKGVIVEINTKAWDSAHRIFPSRRWLDRLIENDIDLIVNSDAHYPDKTDAGRDYGIWLVSRLRRLHHTLNQS